MTPSEHDKIASDLLPGSDRSGYTEERLGELLEAGVHFLAAISGRLAAQAAPLSPSMRDELERRTRAAGPSDQGEQHP